MIQLHTRIREVCPLVAASLILPVLAFVDRNRDSHEQRGGGRGTSRLSLRQTQGGAMLLFSWLQFSRAEA